MKLFKKAVALLIVTVMAMTLFVGCAKSKEETLDPNEVVMIVGETEVTMNIANFFIRYNQSLMESVYESYIGEDVWMTEVEDGVTYEDSLKDSLLDELQNLYIITNHVADYNVTLTDEEIAAIEAAADSFIAENEKEEELDKVSGDKETVVAYLKLYTLNEKMGEAMRADVDSVVTDEQAAQKRMRYFEIAKTAELDDGSTMEMSDEEIADAKKEAEEFLSGAKANGSMEAYATEKEETTQTLAFDADSTALDEEVIKAADALGEGEFSEVIETETGIYVVQLESLFDAEATESAKETVLTERQEARYEELLEKWTEETEITVHEEVWDKISVQGLKVVYTEDETEETEEETEE